MQNFKENQVPRTLRDKFKYERDLGSGTFGVVCKYQKDGKAYAIKFEQTNNSSSTNNEKKVLKDIINKNALISDPNLRVNVPFLYEDGMVRAENNSQISFNFLILDFFEKNIYQANEILTKGQLAVQMFKQLENLHRMGYVHRDVKLDNFMIHNKEVYLIDFGSSKTYRTVKQDGSQNHIPLQTQCKFEGTPYTASLNSHRGIEVSRVDDLISVVYSLLWLWEDNLSWKDALNQQRDQPLQSNEQIALCYKHKLKLRSFHLVKYESQILFQILKYYLDKMQDLQYEEIDIDYEFIYHCVAQIDKINNESDLITLLNKIK
ncbi:ck1 family protein kinase [Stylonychia lemnae]|uniref:Casein kinase I n=1 Tax=Stylonychia lemnae TaxID=5949 RepID=A0A078AG00_STYLE|nr:ck1 family protein kinase [Stylonychia lemnae]|eukprot:CDW80781.1 ck1 family protein kinase [Stylonychia lemnae]